MVFSKIESNHMLLSMQLVGRIIALSMSPPKPPWPFGTDRTVPQWMSRAAHDARELILARRALIRVTESEVIDDEDYTRIWFRVQGILEPYGIALDTTDPESRQCLFLKLPNGDSNEPTGKCWLVPS